MTEKNEAGEKMEPCPCAWCGIEPQSHEELDIHSGLTFWRIECCTETCIAGMPEVTAIAEAAAVHLWNSGNHRPPQTEPRECPALEALIEDYEIWVQDCGDALQNSDSVRIIAKARAEAAHRPPSQSLAAPNPHFPLKIKCNQCGMVVSGDDLCEPRPLAQSLTEAARKASVEIEGGLENPHGVLWRDEVEGFPLNRGEMIQHAILRHLEGRGEKRP